VSYGQSQASWSLNVKENFSGISVGVHLLINGHKNIEYIYKAVFFSHKEEINHVFYRKMNRNEKKSTYYVLKQNLDRYILFHMWNICKKGWHEFRTGTV
jgi:hypothetical protein